MTGTMDKSTAIRAVIVDDEAYARQKIREFLRPEKDIEVVGEAGNGSEAIRVIREQKPDLVFLDIQMPKPDGFGVIEALGDGLLPHIVFATAYDQYALRAFEIRALDYLLKPFDRDRFRQSLKHARDIIGMEKDRNDFRARVRGLLEDMRTEIPYLRRFLVQSKLGVRFLNAEDVLYLEAAGSYVALHTEAGEHLLRETLNDLEKKLDPRVFIRTHRSFIVNVGAIQEIQRHFHGESVIILKNGRRVNVSRNYREHFRKALEGRL
jgi:two-component system LytT family response regulator